MAASAVGFLSYAHADNDAMNGFVAKFHKRLSGEVLIALGSPLSIFIDRDLKAGEVWRKRVVETLDNAVFLIPILTEGFFRSPECQAEVQLFRELRADRRKSDHVLPVLLSDCRSLKKKWPPDHWIEFIKSRQWSDWTQLRHNHNSVPARREYTRLAKRITAILEDRSVNFTPAPPTARDKANPPKELLDLDLAYESLLRYASYMAPAYEPSPTWTRDILRDIDKARYRTIRDVHRVVYPQWRSVLGFAIQQPLLFQWSTDFVSKGLIFGDRRFRKKHLLSPKTLERAEELDPQALSITRKRRSRSTRLARASSKSRPSPSKIRKKPSKIRKKPSRP